MKWLFGKSTKKGRASRIAIKPPVAAPDRQGLALVTIAKNEEDKITDWLTFHAVAGVREVILYDNMSTDRTADIARSFTGMDVTVIPWQLHTETCSPVLVLPRQILAYCHALSTFGGRFRWMAMVDIDEYIVPKSHASIPEALETLSGHANISLPWTMFGHNGHDMAPETPVPFAYTSRAKVSEGPLLNFKCIVDPSEVTKVSVHKFETASMGRTSSNTLGRFAHNKRRKSDNFVTHDVLQLNHYYLMSREETEAKLNRGAVSGVPIERRTASVREKQDIMEKTAVSDKSALEFLERHGILTVDDFIQRTKGRT